LRPGLFPLRAKAAFTDPDFLANDKKVKTLRGKISLRIFRAEFLLKNLGSSPNSGGAFAGACLA